MLRSRCRCGYLLGVHLVEALNIAALNMLISNLALSFLYMTGLVFVMGMVHEETNHIHKMVMSLIYTCTFLPVVLLTVAKLINLCCS